MMNKIEPIRYTTVVGIIIVLLNSFLATKTLAKDENTEREKTDSKQALGRTVEFVLPSLSATHVSWHEPSDQEIMSSAIELSSDGLKVRELGANSFHEMLQDFNGQRSWFIDHERSVSHLLQMDDSIAQDTPEPDTPGLDTPEPDRPDPGSFSGFLGPVPCGPLKAENKGPGRWRGRQVTAFHCVDESESVLTIEFLDDEYQIVVYRRTYDGFIDELRGLSDRTFNESHFIPPTEYRSVDKQEFFFGAPTLLPYSPEAD